MLLCGDDHAAKSSLAAHRSEHVLVTAMAPVLYPATTDEILSFGQYGRALSRVSGLYVGMKTVTDTLHYFGRARARQGLEERPR
ncbi:MAG: hypothetical protein P8Y48_00475 [Novosphingobium sp.]